MTDYGLDMSCATSIDPSLRNVTGSELMLQVICRRLFTTPGSMLSAPDEQTINMQSYLSAGIFRDARGVARIQGEATAAVLADPRVIAAQVRVRWDESTETLSVEVNGTGSTGPFALTLAVSEVSVRIL